MTEPWTGTHTALVTPLQPDGRLDEPALSRLVARQIDAGVDGLVPCGTTGETATLSDAEREQVVRVVCREAAGRVPVLAGAGGNATAAVAALARRLETAGADGILSVVPYYNKPTAAGLERHFTAVADAVSVPVVLYNVPSRTGTNLAPATVIRLADHERVVGIKEASGRLEQTADILAHTKDFTVLSGDDELSLPLLALGAHGVVSVVANLAPAPMVELVAAARRGDLAAARERHYALIDLMRLMFVESNPIPVKAGLAMLGLIEESYRLPLVPLSDAHRPTLRAALDALRLADHR